MGCGELASERRDAAAARHFFTRTLTHGPVPVEVTAEWKHHRYAVRDLDAVEANCDA